MPAAAGPRSGPYVYRCDSCKSIVTTPAPYRGPHLLPLPPFGLTSLHCTGRLVRIEAQ